MFPSLGSHPIDRMARHFLLLQTPGMSEDVLIQWFIAEKDPEIFGELWDALTQRHTVGKC